MKRKFEAEIVYSESFKEINSPRFKDWGVHVLCLEGFGSFNYNGKNFTLVKNDAAVISHPELVSEIKGSDDLKIIMIAAPFPFMYNLLPANHYGVGGCISLFDDPVIPLSEEDAKHLNTDFQNIKERINDCHHLFYNELIGSLCLTMIYDFFDFHAKLHEESSSSNRTGNIIQRLLTFLESGRSKSHREVAYYANQLHVTPKYLAETVKRTTGRSVTYLIDQHTVPMITDYLNNSDLSLSQICEEMNFSSLSYFSRYVKKHLGMTPNEYRASHSPIKKKIESLKDQSVKKS